MRILVCGDRNWTNKDKIKEVLESLLDTNIVMVGEQRGATTLAWEAAKELGKVPMVYPSDWTRNGKAAGIVRDREMLDDKPNLVLAFHSHIRLSRETVDLITEARKRGIPTRIIT